jgi:uncharacterized flavoprotein (TIGR03862 family)
MPLSLPVPNPNLTAAVVGAGPAGLMAAEVLAQGGAEVDVYDAMPSAGRKFLLAGKGGLNLTHGESLDHFILRYNAASQAAIARWLDGFGPGQLREWTHGLGVETFVGSSGRVFPAEMKAAPMLRKWLARLRGMGVRFHMRHRWQGWQYGDAGTTLRFDTPHGETVVSSAVMVLALGGGSWARLGSDGAWVAALRKRQVGVADLVPANCGFDTDWTDHFRGRFSGLPLKSVAASTGPQGVAPAAWRRGEFMITDNGVEGGLVYALSASLRDAIAAGGPATLRLDLAPDFSLEKVQAEVQHPRGARSLSSHLQSRLNLRGVKMGLLRECLPAAALDDPARLAAGIKSLPLRLLRARPLDEAISSAGGVQLDALDDDLMLRAVPHVFCAGEMLDWEAPTGGYLLTACMASGIAAGLGALRALGLRP